MKLAEWLALPGNTSVALAKKLKCSHSTVLRLASGHIAIAGERAIEIEAATDGEVKCHELRPDLWPKRRAA